jgi:hypothetical protein
MARETRVQPRAETLSAGAGVAFRGRLSILWPSFSKIQAQLTGALLFRKDGAESRLSAPCVSREVGHATRQREEQDERRSHE